MSTNDSAYLKDETGGRRFLIVKLGKVADTHWLATHRDNLLAEALYRLEVGGETTYEFSDAAAATLREIQESRTQSNGYDDVVVDWYLGRTKDVQEKGVSTLDIYNACINTSTNPRELSKPMSNDIANIVTRLLYLTSIQRPDSEGIRRRKWYPSEETRSHFKLGKEFSDDGVDEFLAYGKEEETQED
jgi:hypothetical protein